jgi:hypothetical protein
MEGRTMHARGLTSNEPSQVHATEIAERETFERQMAQQRQQGRSMPH